MLEQQTQRRLAAVLAADVDGYTRLMHIDGAGTINIWWAVGATTISPKSDVLCSTIPPTLGPKFMRKYFAVLTLLAVLGSTVVQSAVAQQVLNFATLDEFSPFTWKDNGQAKGIDIDIVKEMCQRIGVKCDIRFYPWKRVLTYTEQGKSDGGFGAFKNPTREAFAYFLEYPVHYSTYSVFVKKGHEFSFKKIEDLYGKNIGINRGFKLNKEFDEAANTTKFVCKKPKI